MNTIETFVNQEMLYSVFELLMYIIVGSKSPIITDNLVLLFTQNVNSHRRCIHLC